MLLDIKIKTNVSLSDNIKITSYHKQLYQKLIHLSYKKE